MEALAATRVLARGTEERSAGCQLSGGDKPGQRPNGLLTPITSDPRLRRNDWVAISVRTCLGHDDSRSILRGLGRSKNLEKGVPD